MVRGLVIERRRIPHHWGQAVMAPGLGHINGRLQYHHGCRVLVDKVTDYVVDYFCLAYLGARHNYNGFYGRVGHGVHDFALVFGPACSPPPWLRARLWR